MHSIPLQTSEAETEEKIRAAKQFAQRINEVIYDPETMKQLSPVEVVSSLIAVVACIAVKSRKPSVSMVTALKGFLECCVSAFMRAWRLITREEAKEGAAG